MFNLLTAPNDDFESTSRAPVAKVVHRQSCFKCAGSGVWRPAQSFFGVSTGRKCFACDGKGYQEFATAPEVRAKAKASAERRKEKAIVANLAAFIEAHPAEAEWIANTKFDFAVSMSQAVQKYGSLTDGQMAAVHRCMARDAERAAEKAKAAQVAESRTQAVDAKALEEAFAKAIGAGLKAPKIAMDGLCFTLAKASSANAGAIYVKAGKEYEAAYLGKIIAGRFTPSRDCDETTKARVADVMADPLQAAAAYGKRTGMCCICSRELTDPVSIERGIGPICESRMF